jgi:hypothetical protein
MPKHHDGAEQRDLNQRWTHRGNKFVIGTIHGESIEIIAQYNPKEVARQAAATWAAHPNTSAKYASNGESQMWSEYKTTAPRTMTVELLFDGYEEGISIAPIVEKLERLTIPVDMSSREESNRRPQLCVAVWGAQQLRCVVQSVATKLTMFDGSGEPLRASCTVTLVEVDVVAMMKSDVHGAIDSIAAKTGNRKHHLRNHSNPYPPEDSKPTKVPPPSRSAAPASTSAAPAAKSAPAPAAAKPAPAAQPAAAPQPDPVAEKVDDDDDDDDDPSGDDASDASSQSTGKPSAKINPAALDGAEPGTGPLFADEAPAATPAPAQAPANTVGKPSAQVDPKAMDGEGDHVFVGEQPKPQTGTPSKQVDPSSMDGQSDVFGEPAPDAVSSADGGTADPKYKAAAEDME